MARYPRTPDVYATPTKERTTCEEFREGASLEEGLGGRASLGFTDVDNTQTSRGPRVESKSGDGV